MEMRRSTAGIWSMAMLLPLMFACSGSNGDDGGGASGVGATMSDLADLSDKVVGENQAAYDGVAFVADSLAATFGGGLAAAVLSAKQNGGGCIPSGYAGVTHELDAPSGTFVSSDIPGAPVDAARFHVYETNSGVPSSTVIGTVDVSCSGVFPGNINLRIVVTVNGVVLLDLNAMNAIVGPQGYSAQVSGFLSSADGADIINFGAFGFEGGSYVSEDFMYGGGEDIVFDLGDNIIGLARSSTQRSPGIESDNVFLQVYQQYNPVPFEYACPSLQFEADLRGSGATLSGPGVFCAPPPTADGFNYHVACYQGTRDGVMTSTAARSCLTELYELDPTPVSQNDLDLIERGTNGLLGMYRAVSGVARVAGAMGVAIAAEQAQQQQF